MEQTIANLIAEAKPVALGDILLGGGAPQRCNVTILAAASRGGWAIFRERIPLLDVMFLCERLLDDDSSSDMLRQAFLKYAKASVGLHKTEKIKPVPGRCIMYKLRYNTLMRTPTSNMQLKMGNILLIPRCYCDRAVWPMFCDIRCRCVAEDDYEMCLRHDANMLAISAARIGIPNVSLYPPLAPQAQATLHAATTHTGIAQILLQHTTWVFFNKSIHAKDALNMLICILDQDNRCARAALRRYAVHTKLRLTLGALVCNDVLNCIRELVVSND